MRYPVADHRCRADDRSRTGGQGRQAGPEDVAQAGWQLGIESPAGDQFLDVERQAIGAVEQRVDHRGSRPSAEDARELLPELLAVEGAEVDPLDSIGAVELGQDRSQRVAPIQVVAAVRRRRSASARRACCGRRTGRGRGSTRQPSAGPRARGRAGASAEIRPSVPMTASNSRASRPAGSDGSSPVVADVRSGVSTPKTSVDGPNAAARAAGSMRRASPRNASTNGAYGRPPCSTSRQPPIATSAPPASARCRELGDEPALADAGVSRHQDQRRLAERGPPQCRIQTAELLESSDEDRAAATSGHAADDARPPSRGQHLARRRRRSRDHPCRGRSRRSGRPRRRRSGSAAGSGGTSGRRWSRRHSSASAQSPRRRSWARNRAIRPVSFIVVPPWSARYRRRCV